jgi:hypothetical protein
LLKLFKTGEIATGRLSKVVGAVVPTFQLFIGNLFAKFQNRQRLPLAGFQNLSMHFRDICHRIGAKDFELAGCAKLSANSKAFFGTEGLRNY